VIARLRSAWREYGTLGLAFRAVAASLATASAGRLRVVWYVLCAQPVRNDWRLPSRMGKDIEVRRVEPHDPVLAQPPRPPDVIAARFAQGAICIAAHRDGELLGFLWLCPRRYFEDEVRCVFVIGDADEGWWDFDVWVAQAHRNGIVFARLWQSAHDYLRGVNARYTCSRIAGANAASMAAHWRLGAVTLGHAIFLCGRRWQLALGGKPWLHLSRDPRCMPTFVVGPRGSDVNRSVHSATPPGTA
jgi:hypothetical protein